MKKILLLITISLFFSFTGFSQINKGSIFLGGTIGVSKNKPDNSSYYTSSYVFISPQIGIAIKENTVAGLVLLYNSTENSPQYKLEGYGGGFFFRKYKPLGKNFYFFAHGQLLYEFDKQTSTSNVNQQHIVRQSNISLNLYPGLSYAVSKRFHLEATINNLLNISYSFIRIDDLNFGTEYITHEKDFAISTSASASIPVNIGFRFILGK